MYLIVEWLETEELHTSQTKEPLDEAQDVTAQGDWLGSADNYIIYSDGDYELNNDTYADYLSGTWISRLI